MGKTVWILNHYAGNMFILGGGRHYSLAKYLKEENGYNPIVFCSNYDHFTHKNCIDSDSLWIEKKDVETGVPYVFIKTRVYHSNGYKRVLNMYDFYLGLIKTAKLYASENGIPDVIYASSVHPLTLVAGIKIANKFGVKCICEVRDLWPESIVAYSTKLTRKNPVIRCLYVGEKWIYKKSDYLIMTWPGGYDYIREQGWGNDIPETKVFHISNGVDLQAYMNNMQNCSYSDSDLLLQEYKNFIYTGSVRKVNNLRLLVSTAQKLKEMHNDTARILVYGDGDELESLKSVAVENHLDNIVFKGRVSKKYIPSILSQGYASLLHNSSTSLDKYGQSQNKFFEYLAAGRPVLMTYSVGHSVIRKYECGIEVENQNSETIAQAITSLCKMSNQDYQRCCKNAMECAQKYDYQVLCDQLITVINKCFT